MSLLTQILGGLAGNALGGRGGDRRAGGLSPVLMSLLPVVLSMLSQRGQQGGAGGLGSIFGGGAGGGAGGGGAPGGGMGGLGDLLSQLTQKGYGREADSWVGTGANQALPPQAIEDVFGQEQLQRIAQQAGISSDEARSGLSELLPDVVDQLTPDGALPPGDQLSASVDEYLRRLG